MNGFHLKTVKSHFLVALANNVTGGGGGFFLLNVLHIYLFSAVLHGAPSAVKEKTKMPPIFTKVMIVPFLTFRLFQGHYSKKYCTYQVPFYLCVF